MREWRRDFHAHPELGFRERRTADIVAGHLESLGFDVKTEVARTGVVGVLRGRGAGPGVLARFDMDALPIQERTGTEYASRAPGIMHACGHDGHVAVGMGVAQVLAENRSRLRGTVKLVFQPAEEGLGGARAMLEEGVLEDPSVDLCLALHLWTEIPAGCVVANEGPVAAASDRVTLRVSGAGGHGALPHRTQDVVVAAAAIVGGLQTVVARNVAPTDSAVVSITGLAAGGTYNVIPEEATLRATVRTFSDETRHLVHRRVEELASGVAAAYGCSATVRRSVVSPVVDNDVSVAKRVRAVAHRLLGSEQLLSGRRLTMSDDMGYFLAERPGCYFLVGAGSGGSDGVASHHSPTFELDERSLPVAAELMTAALLDLTGSEEI